ncbi:MAG: ribonuclease III [Clostridia bacterium]|nr:ribonuclease III [Clostridia bacterium]MBQ3956534.1 ribonuclease III [Clostridia bacterium]
MNLEPMPAEELEKKIGYTFQDRDLLIEALTHSSYHNEMKSKGKGAPYNERLEFLGDSVLSIIVSSYLFERFRSKQEGDLTKIRAAVVCEKALAKYASEIGLGSYMFLGHGEVMNNGRERPSITADAFEALLAAIYLDTGEDFEAVSAFLMPFVTREISAVTEAGVYVDYKTALQQIVQQASGEILEYVLVEAKGPDHNKQFSVEARLNSNIIGRGAARTKREAEQHAAKEALVLFGELPE